MNTREQVKNATAIVTAMAIGDVQEFQWTSSDRYLKRCFALMNQLGILDHSIEIVGINNDMAMVEAKAAPFARSSSDKVATTPAPAKPKAMKPVRTLPARVPQVEPELPRDAEGFQRRNNGHYVRTIPLIDGLALRAKGIKAGEHFIVRDAEGSNASVRQTIKKLEHTRRIPGRWGTRAGDGFTMIFRKA